MYYEFTLYKLIVTLYFVFLIAIYLLPNEILFETFEILIFYTSYKFILSLKPVCKHWNYLVQYAIQRNIKNRFKMGLQLEVYCSQNSNFYKEKCNSYIGVYN